MSSVGQKEKKTQQRVLKLFRDTLAYRYLGNWEERENNRNLEPELLRAWLKQQGHSDALVGKVLYELNSLATRGKYRNVVFLGNLRVWGAKPEVRLCRFPSPLFSLPSSPSQLVVEFSEFFSCMLSAEFSESFSCILFTEFSESWTAASLARIVDGVRVTKNNGPNAMLPILKIEKPTVLPQAACHLCRPSS